MTTSVLRGGKPTLSRLSKSAAAAETIAGFSHGTDIVGLTHGQFSLIDLLHAVLDIVGPADVDIATWSTGLYDAEAARRFVEDGRIRRIRFIMDARRKNKWQPDAADIADLFGDDAIRTTRTHAKFMLVSNQDWHVVCLSSMNLNRNPRVEQFSLTEDAGQHAFFTAWVDEVWSETPAGGSVRADDRRLPVTAGIPSVAPVTGVSNVGRVTVGPVGE